MKKTIALLLVIAFALIACDNDDNGNGKDKEEPHVPNPATITQTNGLAFDGTVIIKTDDLYLDADWDAVVANVITAFNAAYEATGNAGKNDFRKVSGNEPDIFGNGGNGLEIILVNGLSNNWEVRDGEMRTLYLKTGSIATVAYRDVIIYMLSNSPYQG